MIAKLPKNKQFVALVGFFLLIVVSFVIFSIFYKIHVQEGSVKISKIVARVEGIALSQIDLDEYKKIHVFIPQNNVLLSGLEGLKRATVIQLEAARQNVYPTKDELDGQIKRELEKAGGKDRLEQTRLTKESTYSHWEKAVELELIKEKLLEKLSYWREAEFIAMRFDVLPKHVEPTEIPNYQTKAKVVLEKVKERFNNGEKLDDLVAIVLADEVTKADFSENAIQFSVLSTDDFTRKSQRYTKKLLLTLDENEDDGSKAGDYEEPRRLEVQPLEKHILEMEAPKSQELWCENSACYLIRVTAGSNGSYSDLNDWLVEKGFR